MNQDIILTTGIYDLIKDLLRRKKVTPFVEDQLIVQLKRAKQIRRRELPSNVVTIDCRVTIKDILTNELQDFTFVAPSKAKRKKMHEKPYRSVVKTISWRTVGTLDTIIISYFITGNLVMAASIGSIEVVTKMILYYFHERAWNKLSFGRIKEPAVDYQI